MLDLAEIPLFSKERNETHPIIIGGGPCTCNPEPLAEFFDIFVLGEGEEVTLEILDLYKSMRDKSKLDFLQAVSQIGGVYVPSLYEVSYSQDGTILGITPQKNAPSTIQKRIIKNLDTVYYPHDFTVPFTEVVHDRVSMEILRGCVRGCRFCQAGFIYRPYREKSADVIVNCSKELCKNTGYDELSLISLSSGDYSALPAMLGGLVAFTEPEQVNLAFPSMRMDNFSPELHEKIKKVRASTLTFAPEAGTQRLRNVINKNITEEEIMNACKTAFEGGTSSLKLYFMLGLPTETDEDITGIAELARRITDLYYKTQNRPKQGLMISISAATFVPKPFTPFQYRPQATADEIRRKQALLRLELSKNKRVRLSVHPPESSIVEAVLARGDRRLCAVVYDAWKNGAKFEGWGEYFSFSHWEKALQKHGLTCEFYASRKREYDEIPPWGHLDYLVDTSFFIAEDKRAESAENIADCRQKCSACGVSKATNRKCETNPSRGEKEPLATAFKAGAEKKIYIPVRIIFSKTGKAKFISHLDLNRCMERAFRKSKLPLWHTEGFNPHPYSTYALPLSLGFESECEVMDIKLDIKFPLDDVPKTLNSALPPDIQIIRAELPKFKHTDIKAAEYEIVLQDVSKNDFKTFLEQDTIMVQKKSKKGITEIDIRPLVTIISTEQRGCDLFLTVQMPAGTQTTYNPSLLLKAFSADCIYCVKRKQILI
jgi:radical SAM family uncharacterized protein/radical SAM-linked protein